MLNKLDYKYKQFLGDLRTITSSIDTQNLFPDFLCIGGQKCGTSWFYKKLKKTPNIYIPDNRYIHYFDRNLNKPLNWYLDHFKKGKNLCKGEVIPGYGIISNRRIKFIHNLNSDLKIIFIMRDPIERAWSHARMHFKDHGRDLKNVSDKEYINHFDSVLSQKKGDYKTIIDNWKTIFPNKNFHIIFNEDIASQPNKVLQDAISFLNIDNYSEENNKVEIVNRGNSYEMSNICYRHLKKIYKSKIYKLTQEYEVYPRKWYSKHYE